MNCGRGNYLKEVHRPRERLILAGIDVLNSRINSE